MAVIHRNADMAEAIIELCPCAEWLDLENFDFRQTALHLAVLTDQPSLVRKLVVSGARLEKRDRNGNTALHLACKHGFESCIEMLTSPLTPREQAQVPYAAVSTRPIPQDLTIKNYEGEVVLLIQFIRLS
jgi:ankyrin repeat protein